MGTAAWNAADISSAVVGLGSWNVTTAMIVVCMTTWRSGCRNNPFRASFRCVVDAVRARLGRLVERRSQLGLDLADLLDRLADPALGGDPGPFGGSAGAAHATTESDPARELLVERLDLGVRRLRSADVTARLGLFDQLGELGSALAIGRDRLRIQDSARITAIAWLRAARDELEHVDLHVGARQQLREHPHAAHVRYEERAARRLDE